MTKKEQIIEIENQIHTLYLSAPKYEEDYQNHHKWYLENILPLSELKEKLEKEIYSEELFNVKVGDGVTIYTWTDTYAYTVISRTAKTITIQRDNTKRIDHNGISEEQEYEYSPNPEGQTHTFRWSDKKQRWVNGCYHLYLGRHEYYDYSF